MMQPLPVVVAGPIVRRVTADKCYVWLVSSVSDDISLSLHLADGALSGASDCQSVQVGERAFVHLLSFNSENSFPENRRIQYNLHFTNSDYQQCWHSSLQQLLYSNCTSLHFHYTSSPTTILHGSCRKPHFHDDDALAQVDTLH